MKNKKRGPKSKPQEQNPNKFMKKAMNKLCSKASTSHKKHIKKKGGGKPKKTNKLKKTSTYNDAMLQNKTICALYETTNNFCL